MPGYSRPPRLAEWLVYATAPAADRREILGDLSEDFHLLVEQSPSGRARRWYWGQALRSIVPNLIQRRRKSRRRAAAMRAAITNRSRGDAPMQTLLHDLRHTGRGIRKNWGFSLVVILTISLGIGANTLIYSIVDSVILNPFPFPEPDRLVGIGSEWPRLGRELGFFETLSPHEYRDVKNQSETMEHVVMWDLGFRALSAGGERSEMVLSAGSVAG